MLLQMSLAGSGIILAAILLRAATLNRLPKRMFVALWMLAAIRMLLPYTLPCPVSVQTLAKQTPIRAEAPVQTQVHRVESNQAVPASNFAAAPARMQTAAPRRERTLPAWEILYFAGLAVCALALLMPHLKWRRVYAQAIPAEGEAVRRWLSESKGRRRVRVGISDRIAAPLTYGLLRPRILLPAGAEDWEKRRLDYVLEHEWTHIRGCDVAVKGILAAAVCVHWFNPLAWAMFILAGRDMELICDEAVVRRFGPEVRASYATTLIDLAAKRCGRQDALANAFSRAGIEERIGSIMKIKKKSWLSLVLAVVLVLSTAAVFATNAEETLKQEPAARTESDRIVERYMLDGWEEMSLQDYRDALEKMWRNNPESEDVLFSAMQEQNLSQDTLEFVQYVLTPVTTDWERLTGTGWSWSEDLEWSTEDAHAPNWMEVTFGFNVPSSQLVSAGYFRDAVKDVRESMLDWPEGADWDVGHAAQWYSETDEAAQYAEDLSGRAAVLCERWNSDLLKVDIAFVQASREQQLLQKYIPLGLNYKFHGYVDNYRLEMTYDGKPVHSVWDEQEKVLIQYNVNGYDLGDEAIDLTVEYENGQPSRLRIVDDDEKDAAYAQEKPDPALLSLPQPNGWAGMTISEYQRLLWTEHDTPEDIAALQALSSDREFYESRDSDANANYYFNVYEPLTASQWRTRSWDGAARSVMDGRARMEYSMSLTILDADRLTVGEYDAARASMQTELDGILEKYADQEKDALKASVAREVEALSEKYGGEALEIRVEYILEVENSEEAEPAAPDDREPRAYAPGTEEEYASLLQIMPQEQDTVADFNRALLAWSDADYERMERISEDANRNDIRVSLTEAERRFVRLTAELSGVENAKRVQSDYTGRPLEDPVFDGGDFWKQSEDGLCWCNLWYQFSYHIDDPETLTVGERDRRVSGMLGDIEDFWNGASLDELLSGTRDLKKTLADIAGRYSDDQMTLKIEPGRVSFDGYDNRNRA